MSNIRELKQRITSVVKTRKMTQAMKMVSAAKFKRAAQKSNHYKDYANGLQEVICDLFLRKEPDLEPPLLKKNKSHKIAVVIITGDRGLCGGFNNSVIRASENYLKEHKENTELYLFGNKAYTFYKSKEWKIEESKPYFVGDITMEKVEAVLRPILKRYIAGKIGKLVIFYNCFQSGLTSELIHRQILPIDKEECLANASEQLPEGKLKSDFLYDPEKERTVNYFLRHYMISQLYQALIDSKAGEEGARMGAMDAATTNAEEMVGKLKLVYNRTRQANITREITEIVSGVEALAN